MINKPAKTQVPVHDLIVQRWSPRAFDDRKPVSHAQLLALFEAARWAPSCFGDEPWRYMVWNKHSDTEAWQRAFDCLAEGNQIWVRRAPVLLLATSASRFSHNGSPNRWASYDTGAASENICLQATAMGLHAHQMGGFDADKIRQAFSIPVDYHCMAMIAIGYQAEADMLDPNLTQNELAERKREPLATRFFVNAWGMGVTTDSN
ncbi:MAG: nitroreductase family protein [Sulfuriferula sp.]